MERSTTLIYLTGNQEEEEEEEEYNIAHVRLSLETDVILLLMIFHISVKKI